jgi:hypothetical protein
LRPSRQRAFTLTTKPYKNTQKHVVSQLDIAIAWRINQEEKNMDKLLEGLERPERMANIIAQQPKYIRDDIASLVEAEQKPGSFGDLIKRSVELAAAHNELQGSNVVSMIGRQFTK